MKRGHSSFAQLIVMTSELTTTTQVKKCGYLLGQVSSQIVECSLGIMRFIDRILHRGNALDQTAYSRVELRGSDHRPGKM